MMKREAAHQQLIRFFQGNANIDSDILEPLVGRLKTLSVKRNEFLLRPGEVCRQALFIASGLLRYYSVDDKGKEHILQFAPENWFISDRESHYFNHPTEYFIQAFEDSELVAVDDDFIVALAGASKEFTAFNNRLLHNHIRQLQHRINLLLSATAEERYLHFTRMYPDIMLRVPQSMVASYLGMTPESLSRVRRELAGKPL